MNGIVDNAEGPTSPKAHIGKRKRTTSPESKPEVVSRAQATQVQHSLEDAFQLIQKYEHSHTRRIYLLTLTDMILQGTY